jgi:hypothetical protein
MKRTNITIKEEDFKFAIQNGYKLSRLVRERINEIRDFQEGEINFKYANKRLQDKIERIFAVLEELLTEKQFKELTQKI